MMSLSSSWPHSMAAASLSPVQAPPLHLRTSTWESPALAFGPSYLCFLPSVSRHGFKCHLYTDKITFLLGSSDFCIQPLTVYPHLNISQACEIPLARNRPLILQPPSRPRLFPCTLSTSVKFHHHLKKPGTWESFRRLPFFSSPIAN